MHTIRGVCARVCENTHAGVCLLITTKQWVTIWQQRALGNFPSCLIRNSGGPRASPHQLTLGPGWKITIIKQRCARERKRESKSESVWYTMGKQNGRRAGTSYERNPMEQNEVLLQSPKCGKTLMQYWSRKFPLCVVVKGQIYNTIPLWWKQKRTSVFFSFFSPSVLFPLSLASGCDCTGLNSGAVLIRAALWGLM